MKEEKEQSLGINFEAEIIDRINSLVSLKRAENVFALGRLDKMETSWQDINTALDEEIRVEIDLLDDEAEAIEDAKKRLQRNICLGVERKRYGIAGKVVDMDSKIGLPGLRVKIAPSDSEKDEYLVEETTDNYGNFSMELVLKDFEIKEGEPTKFRFDIFLTTDKVVHTEDKQVKPTSGKIDHIILAVKCTGELKGSRDFGIQVKESVENDAELVKLRIGNMKSAYAAFARLPGTTLAFLRDLKAEIAVSPPEIKLLRMKVKAEAEKMTRYLGNSSTHEFHDLQNVRTGCRIDEIRWDHRVYFKSEDGAISAGYDYCAHCFGAEKSRR